MEEIRNCLAKTAKKHKLSQSEVLNILLKHISQHRAFGYLEDDLRILQKEQKFQRQQKKFINLSKKVKTYSKFLSLGKRVLSGELGLITGLEQETIESIKFYNQLKDISEFMFTTGSTNYPDDPTFQPMFLEGLLRKSNALKLADCARDYNFNFIIQELPRGKVIDKQILGDWDPTDQFLIHGAFDLTEQGVGGLPDEIEDLIKEKYPISKLLKGKDPIVGIILEDPIGITIPSGEKLWQQRLFKVVYECLKPKSPRILLSKN